MTNSHYRCHMVFKGDTPYDTFSVDLPLVDELLSRFVNSLLESGCYQEIVVSKEETNGFISSSEVIDIYLIPPAPIEVITITPTFQ